ncbi:chemotaxis protein CheX [Thermanaerothrix sp. 4228-RoL]|uniref:Chemotaxis protein CheX n=1 Tax=Thermanaerothrix solaris TaxID=3058434 RepID=A0ABU3NLA3_9CHLR|nr:chemotaxis protein CheX [Thermanaerothrix sp. 4228-RoL]MDT8897631.1 chemotaxis protein CheX [Thermanaerothrix sp. 4228-RoL]
MNVKFLNPFVESAFEVLKAETGYNLRRGDLGLEKSVYVTEDLTVILSLVGQVEGTVFYSMSQPTALALVSPMMGSEVETLDQLAQSAIAELGNVITGRASVKLAQAGFESVISPPTLLLGNGARISTLDFPRLIVPLEFERGQVTIHLALREGRGGVVHSGQLPTPPRPQV